jgi:Predicted transcriptional regulators
MQSEKIQISLAAARVNANLTQEEVAAIMGVSKTTIVNWEKGRIVPGIPEMSMLSQVYKIPQDYIFLPSYSTKSRKTNNSKSQEEG